MAVSTQFENLWSREDCFTSGYATKERQFQNWRSRHCRGNFF